METAIKYIELLNKFTNKIQTSTATGSVAVKSGRKYDRILFSFPPLTVESTRYFVDKTTWEIFGAKSSFQHNPRRLFGTLDMIDEYDWSTEIPTPLPKTNAEILHNQREAELAASYKPRGRPKKVATTTPAIETEVENG